MIHHLDSVLDHLFKSRVSLLQAGAPPTVIADQVRFQPPDDKWRGHIITLQRKALNVYLFDLRENRNLRSNERVRSFQNGTVNEEPAPVRVDCHYLITAESPASEDHGKTIEEHQLLYQVMAVLLNAQPFVPRRVFAPNPLPGGFPGLISDAELPTTILPVEGYTKLAEFWGTMGVGYRWKPAIYLIVALPIVLDQVVAGPMVTTRVTEYRIMGGHGSGEIWIQIGGQVHNGQVNPPALVPAVWVGLETMTGELLQSTQTDNEGRFVFGEIQAGRYQLHARAPALGDLTSVVDVPSPTGGYDLQF